MKKVLIITYYWPPAGGPGVQRWLNFVKFLPENNIMPVVYVPENATYPITDNSLLQEVPEVEVIKHPIFEPYKIASLLSKSKSKSISKGIIPAEDQSFVEQTLLWIRGNFFIPDARRFWVRSSTKILLKEIQERNIDTVITTGPPHSIHLIGLQLKKKLNFEWITDFRDPWTSIGYHSALKLSNYARKKHKKLEHKVLNIADKIITTSFTTKEEFEKLTHKPIRVITNGYGHVFNEKHELFEDFVLSHIGSFLSGRNPKILWEVLQEMIQEDPMFSKDLKLKLAGVLSEEVLQSITKYELQNYIERLGYLSHNKVFSLQQSSHILLLIEINEEKTRGIIPGKLFEYMAAKRPILALGPEKWDVQKILNETNSGDFFLYTDKDKLKTYLKKAYKAYKENNLTVGSNNIQKYNRKNLTQQLANYIFS